MRTSSAVSGSRSGPGRSEPSNVIPFLVARPRGGCGPMELAAALRRLHRAGLRGLFVLLAPVSPGPAAGTPERDAARWGRLCDRIGEQTSLRIALMDVPAGAGIASVVARNARRAVAIGEVAPGELAALIELSCGVCTTDRDLLAQTRAMGVSAPGPDQLDAAVRDGTLSDLFAHPIAAALPASA